MKKILPLFCLLVTLQYSCGPAAENKQVMHSRAKAFQDSIAKAIRDAIAEAEGPAPQPTAPEPNPATAPQ